MGSHPINLTIRFILKITGLVAIGIWAWNFVDNDLKYIATIGIPILFAISWGLFAVPTDPNLSGKAPIPTKGFIRFFLEIIYFGFATWCLYNNGNINLCIIMGAFIVLHYIFSYDRVIWLFKH